MKNILQLILLWALPLVVSGQNKFSARVPVLYMYLQVYIDDLGKIWVTSSSAGKIFYSEKIGGLWHKKEIATPKFINEIYRLSDGVLLGMHYSYKTSKTRLYNSVDGGKTWKKTSQVFDDRVDCFKLTHEGKVWVVTHKALYVSSDRGKTWQTRSPITTEGFGEPVEVDLAQGDRVGLTRTHSGKLYATNNYGQTWQKLPTPLDQNKYRVISAWKENRIKKVRCLNNHYVINQEGGVFVSATNKVDWKILPNAIDFEVTPSGKLYTITKDLRVVLYNEALKKVWASNQSLKSLPRTTITKNEELFVLTNHRIYQVSPKKFVQAELLTNQPVEPPQKTIAYKGKKYAFKGGDVLRFDQKLQKWYRWLPIYTEVIYSGVLHNQLVVTDRYAKEHFVINKKQRTISKYHFPSQLFSLETNPIVKFKLETRTRDCFATYRKKVKTYVRKGKRFILDSNTSDSVYLPKMPTYIPVEAIHHLVKTLGQSKAQESTWAGLDVLPQDIRALKKLIKEVEQMHKGGKEVYLPTAFSFDALNFPRYISLADSLTTIPLKTINQALMRYSGSGGTVFSQRRIVFTFKDKTTLAVSNTGTAPQYLQVPWKVYYQGLPFTSNSIKFGKLLDQLTQGDFLAAFSAKKEYLLLRVIKYHLHSQGANKK